MTHPVLTASDQIARPGCRIGQPVLIDPGRLEQFFLLQVPIHSSAEIAPAQCLDLRAAGQPANAAATWRRATDLTLVRQTHRRIHPQSCPLTAEHRASSIEQRAEQAEVSVRTLFAGFREFTGTSPMAYQRDIRMERVHQELRAQREASVTDVALKWGFAHPERFSQEHRKRYGELPSTTLHFRDRSSSGG